MMAFFRFVLVLLMLVVVAMTAAILTMHFAIHGAETAMPDFRGMTLADASRRAADAGLTLHVENSLYSAEVPAGRVSNQSPLPGVMVRRGWRVWLTQSLGPQKIPIPNEIGKDERLASIEIRRAGLELGSIAELAWPGASPGSVIGQTPAPNASGVERPVVNLLVAAPAAVPAQEGLVMPDLEGQPFSAAALALTRAGLHQGPVRQQAVAQAAQGAGFEPMTPPPGTILAQNPAAGGRVDAATAVTLTVAQ